MAYSIKSKDASLSAALRRIAADQLRAGIDSLAENDPDTLHTRIHDARKRCKKLRGLVRLVRPGFDRYAEVNAALRDAARPLSGLRDSAVHVDSYDRLSAAAGEEMDRRALTPLRAALTRARVDDPAEVADRAVAFRDELAALQRDVPDWVVAGDDREVLERGLAKTLRRARKAMARAADDPSAERMHDWRKRVKYHWYHARLLKRTWPEAMTPHRRAADRLSDLLGDHHDLAEFARRLEDGDLPEAPALAIRPVLVDESARLERESFALGRFLLAGPADGLAARWTEWWDLARKG